MKQEKIPLISKGTWILLLLMGVGGVCMVYRFAMGLGASTNLSDNTPWGLWVAVDVLVGVALAAGGFTITAAVYVFNMKRYRAIARPAILTAFIGYLMVIAGLIIDIGKPLAFWHPLVMWQHHSIMFEVVWCIALYTTVLALEFSPSFLEKAGFRAVAGLLKKKAILFPLVIAGITLSYLHQSSLGAFFLIVPGKLHKLWYTSLIPQLFYLSSLAAGLAMVSLESILSSRVFKRGYDTPVLRGLARGTSLVLLVYLVVRLTDLAFKGNLSLIAEDSSARSLFLFEIVSGVILPMVILSYASRTGSVGSLFAGQVLVILGIVLNRFNANFLSQTAHGGSYFPSWMEIAVTLGVISFGLFLYRFAVLRLEVFPGAQIRE